MEKLISTYNKIIVEHQLKNNSFLVGSFSILQFLGRTAGDLDFSSMDKPIIPFDISKTFIDYSPTFHQPIEDGVDYYKNRYYVIGYKDKTIVKKGYIKPVTFDLVDTWQVVPEIEIAYKIIMRREKDINDINRIKSHYFNQINWIFVDRITSQSLYLIRIRQFYVLIFHRLEKLLSIFKSLLIKK
jgi:hypothetical protein